MSNLPIILIEVVLIMGAVLAFGIWQLRAPKKQSKPQDQQKKRDEGQQD